MGVLSYECGLEGRLGSYFWSEVGAVYAYW